MTAPDVRRRLAAYPRAFWMLVVGTFVNRTGLVVLPFLALYLATQRGTTITQATLAVSLYGAGAFLGGFAGGWVSDRVGRRPVLIASLVGGAVAVAWIPLTGSYGAAALATFAFGGIGEMYRPAVSAAVADLVDEDRQPEAYAILYWAINLGAAVGPALGGLLAAWSYTALFVLDGATMLAYALVVVVAIPETRPEGEGTGEPVRLGRALRDGTLVALALAVLAVGVAFFQLFSALPLTMNADGLSELDYGLVVTVNGGLIVLVGLPVAAWVGRRLVGWAVPVAVALIAVGLALTAGADTFWTYALASVVWTVGEMAFLPVVPTIVSRLAPVALRGSYQGVYHGAWGLAKMLGPALGGLVLAGYGGPTLWLAAAGLAGTAAVLLTALQPALGRRMVGSPRSRPSDGSPSAR